MNKVDRVNMEPIKTWLSKGSVFPLDTEICNQFNEDLCSRFPWQGFIKDRIEWEEVKNYSRLDWSLASNEDTKKFIQTACKVTYKYLAIIYSALEPGIIGDFDFIIDNLEIINTYSAGGVIFIVGVTKDKNGLFNLHFQDFFEIWSLKLLITTPIS